MIELVHISGPISEKGGLTRYYNASRRGERAHKKTKRKGLVIKEEIRDYLPTDPHETEIMLQEEIPNILSKYFSSNIF
jgi:hypothetical protein